MAVGHDGAAAGGVAWQGVGTLRKAGTAVESGAVAIPGAGMGVLRTEEVAQFMSDNHHGKRIGRHSSISGVDAGKAVLGRIGVTQAGQIGDAAAGLIRNQLPQVAVEILPVIEELRQ